jgi:cytidine deaminase
MSRTPRAAQPSAPRWGAIAKAVVAEAEEPVAPCGICRQSLIEFGEEVKVIMANTKGDAEIATVEELLPRGFTGRYLK